MFSLLPESRRIRSRRIGGTATSFIAHYALVLIALYASAEASPARDGPRQETVVFQQPAPDPPRSPAVPEDPVAPPPPRQQSMLTVPLSIPDVLPGIDLRQTMTAPEAFAGRGHTPVAAEPAVASRPDPGAIHTVDEVERAAALVANAPRPVYPEALRRAGVEGNVLVSFVVDTLGRPDMSTFTVLRASHDLLAQAVRRAVSHQQFVPAEVGVRKVRQLVQQPFAFSIVR
ncbi:MAG TPA: TonB family protein [Gemmatimonadaceae bacterium]